VYLQKMLLLAFPLFSNFPPEIRDRIWEAAIWPRLVLVQEKGGPEYNHIGYATPLNLINQKSGSHYLYSNSPVPPLLQACSESRQAMMAAGYALMFPILEWEPRIWFSFKHDYLYFGKEVHAFGAYQLSSKYQSLLRCSSRDRRRVKNIALQMSLSSGNPAPLTFDISHILRMFGHVENILIVEQHCGDFGHPARGKPDVEGNLWGYVECDISDTLGHSFSIGDSRTDEYSWHKSKILEYKKMNGGHGRDYFQHLAGNLELELERHRNTCYRIVDCEDGKVLVRPGQQAYSIPRVQIVTVTTRTASQQLMQRRERYWEAIQEIEDEEAKCGPKEVTGYDAIWEDAIEEYYSLNE
jgi:hypothetical protein